jgi:hypothetical protein
MNYENLSIKDLFDLLDQKQNLLDKILEFIDQREENLKFLSENNSDDEVAKKYKIKRLESLIIKSNIDHIIFTETKK